MTASTPTMLAPARRPIGSPSVAVAATLDSGTPGAPVTGVRSSGEPQAKKEAFIRGSVRKGTVRTRVRERSQRRSSMARQTALARSHWLSDR